MPVLIATLNNQIKVIAALRQKGVRNKKIYSCDSYIFMPSFHQEVNKKINRTSTTEK